jgi:multidrug resistance efflux pump
MGFKFKSAKVSNSDNNRASIRKNIAKWQWYLVAAVIMSPLLIFIYSVASDYWFVSANGYIKINKYEIKAPEDSYIKSVNVSPGDLVNQGNILVELSAPILSLQKKELKEQLNQIKEIQKQLVNHQKSDLIKMLNDSVKYFERIRKEYVKFEEYLDKGIITLMEFVNIQQAYFQAELQIHNIQKMINQSDTDQLIDDESNFLKDIRGLTGQISLLDERISSLLLKAPKNGNIIEVFGNEGEFVTKGQTLMFLTDNSPPYIKAYLDPKYLYMVEKGGEVQIAFPDKFKMNGVIEYQPSFSQVDDTTVNTFKDKESKIILMIRPEKKIPEKYLIYNSPVKVLFN